jgi:hypothetical protein
MCATCTNHHVFIVQQPLLKKEESVDLKDKKDVVDIVVETGLTPVESIGTYEVKRNIFGKSVVKRVG